MLTMRNLEKIQNVAYVRRVIRIEIRGHTRHVKTQGEDSPDDNAECKSPSTRPAGSRLWFNASGTHFWIRTGCGIGGYIKN